MRGEVPVRGQRSFVGVHLLLETQQAGVQQTTIPGGCSAEKSRR